MFNFHIVEIYVLLQDRSTKKNFGRQITIKCIWRFCVMNSIMEILFRIKILKPWLTLQYLVSTKWSNAR